MIALFVILPVAVVVALTVSAIRRDPRWLGNAYLLGLCVLLVLPLLALMIPVAGALLAGIVLMVLFLAPLGALVLVAFLIANGLTMLRRERRSLANLLSLLAGIGIAVAMVLSLQILLRPESVLTPFALAAVLGFGYLGGEFAFYLGYSWVYARIARRVPADYVVVLGAGLRDGRTVGPLLAGRVDEGIARYRELRARGRDTRLVMSGGKGDDEHVPEAQAMAEYAIGQGVPADHVLREDQSRNTFENLTFTRQLILGERVGELAGSSAAAVTRAGDPVDADTGSATPATAVLPAPPRPPLPWFAPPLRATMLIVTSDFHAMRAAMYARRLGLPAQAVGCRTARYYWPSAVLREFVAVVNERRIKHLVLLLLIAVPLPLLVAVLR
ncbi:hypothetical protein BI335_03760 [Enemella evansiae]|uniref:YdcF family protein n=1 Tax=Enemella evansiae TaxID=2016499 RepID=UPI000B9763F7|nr:YdcF family protein [Enemella evansiae]OYO20639.1 hypothetical protein BI335_03760 [Enemella evansiae]